MAKILDIAQEIAETDTKKAAILALQTENISTIPLSVLARQKEKLEAIERSQLTPLAQRVRDYLKQKHGEINQVLSDKNAQEKITAEGYSRYLIQAWYCSSYTPQLQVEFSQRLTQYLESTNGSKFERGRKFIRMVDSEIDEETGHEIWVLQDLQQLGIQTFDKVAHVFEESKALISTQFDRLNRLNFIGFLGYSSYLEFLLAKHAAFKLELLSQQGIPREAQTFLYNHYVVDQHHAAEQIELFNFLIDSEENVTEVIENINIVHLLYKGLLARAFS